MNLKYKTFVHSIFCFILVKACMPKNKASSLPTNFVDHPLKRKQTKSLDDKLNNNNSKTTFSVSIPVSVIAGETHNAAAQKKNDTETKVKIEMPIKYRRFNYL